MDAPKPYNPLDKTNLGSSVADALLANPVGPLPPEPFIGAGVYAIYYVGDYPAYEPIAKRNRDGQFKVPIYVGKAIPEGARKGGMGLDVPAGTVMHRRLREHGDSVKEAKNLKSEDFFCRYIVTDDIWIPLGESLIINKFQPVWNRLIDGFGNHDPGKGRYQQQRSLWDVLHPGRGFALKLQENRSNEAAIIARIRTHFEALYSSMDDFDRVET